MTIGEEGGWGNDGRERRQGCAESVKGDQVSAHRAAGGSAQQGDSCLLAGAVRPAEERGGNWNVSSMPANVRRMLQQPMPATHPRTANGTAHMTHGQRVARVCRPQEAPRARACAFMCQMMQGNTDGHGRRRAEHLYAATRRGNGDRRPRRLTGERERMREAARWGPHRMRLPRREALTTGCRRRSERGRCKARQWHAVGPRRLYAPTAGVGGNADGHTNTRSVVAGRLAPPGAR